MMHVSSLFCVLDESDAYYTGQVQRLVNSAAFMGLNPQRGCQDFLMTRCEYGMNLKGCGDEVLSTLARPI